MYSCNLGCDECSSPLCFLCLSSVFQGWDLIGNYRITEWPESQLQYCLRGKKMKTLRALIKTVLLKYTFTAVLTQNFPHISQQLLSMLFSTFTSDRSQSIWREVTDMGTPAQRHVVLNMRIKVSKTCRQNTKWYLYLALIKETSSWPRELSGEEGRDVPPFHLHFCSLGHSTASTQHSIILMECYFIQKVRKTLP